MNLPRRPQRPPGLSQIRFRAQILLLLWRRIPWHSRSRTRSRPFLRPSRTIVAAGRTRTSRPVTPVASRQNTKIEKKMITVYQAVARVFNLSFTSACIVVMPPPSPVVLKLLLG